MISVVRLVRLASFVCLVKLSGRAARVPTERRVNMSAQSSLFIINIKYLSKYKTILKMLIKDKNNIDNGDLVESI